MWEEVKNDSYISGLLRTKDGVKIKEDFEPENDAKKNHKSRWGKIQEGMGLWKLSKGLAPKHQDLEVAQQAISAL